MPAVNVQWLNDVLFGLTLTAEQCTFNPKYQNFKLEDPFRMDYSLVPHLIAAWKNPIRVTPETYNKFKANPPARIKRKAEKQRMEKEEAKRMREAEELKAGGPAQGQEGQQQPQQQQQQQGQQGQVQNGDQANPNQTNAGQNPSESTPKPEAEVPGGEVKKDEGEKKPEEEKPKEEPKTDSSTNKENESSNEAKPLNSRRIVFTGFVPSELDEMTTMANKLGCEILPSAKADKASHLVMPKMGRTITFLCGLPHADHILSKDWVKESSKAGKWLGKFSKLIPFL